MLLCMGVGAAQDLSQLVFVAGVRTERLRNSRLRFRRMKAPQFLSAITLGRFRIAWLFELAARNELQFNRIRD